MTTEPTTPTPSAGIASEIKDAHAFISEALKMVDEMKPHPGQSLAYLIEAAKIELESTAIMPADKIVENYVTRYGWKMLSWQDRKGNKCNGWKSPNGQQCAYLPDALRIEALEEHLTAQPNRGDGERTQAALDHAQEAFSAALKAEREVMKVPPLSDVRAADGEIVDWLEATEQRGHYCGTFAGELLTRANIRAAMTARGRNGVGK